MPIPRRYYEELQEKREAEHVLAERDRGRAMWRAGWLCVFWCVLGLVSYGFALHTTDAFLGEVFSWLAHVITYGGISVTLARAYVGGERRGDW